MGKTKPAPAQHDTDTDTDAPGDVAAESVVLEFRGETFEVPRRRGRWPIEAVLQFGRGNGLRAFYELMGQHDWQRLRAVAPTLDDFDEFYSPAVEQLRTECIG